MPLNAFAELNRSPYVVDDGKISHGRFMRVRETCREASEIAIRAQERIRRQAGESFPAFADSIRSNIVAESNRIEGYDWSAETVAEVVQLKRELLSLPIRSFVDGVRNDSRVYQALGLYRAHQLADEWVESGGIPGESDIRAFHSLIAAGEDYAGRYKTIENEIQGSSLKTCPPWDVARSMADLVQWWRSSQECEPVLVATVVHAWLTQIHPFEDGNGRIARLIANLALSQRKYPPLVLKSDSDRGQYLDALSHSDDGDILPLYELFSRVARRQVGIMGNHEYVRSVIERRLFSDIKVHADIWKNVVDRFTVILNQLVSDASWVLRFDGYPDEGGFDLLLRGKSEGSSWYARCGPHGDSVAILLWWGFESLEFRDFVGDEKRKFPSLFVSTRFGSGKHPYKREETYGLEIQFRPFTTYPIFIKSINGMKVKTHLDGGRLLIKILKDLYMSGDGSAVANIK